jgi:hypothetical protein
MRNKQGLALVLLLVTTMLLFMLGAALFTVAQADFRISRHLADWEQARYSAEAGVAAALSLLPRDPRLLAEVEGGFAQDAEPAFAVEWFPGENSGEMWLYSTGKARGKEREVRALAVFQPFGGFAAVAESLRLEQVDIYGHVKADEVEFTYGESRLYGNLCCRTVWCTMGGDFWLAGWEREPLGDGYPLLDFTELATQALAGGWEWIEAGGEAYRLGGEHTGELQVFIRGDLQLAEDFQGSGIVLVSGNAEFSCLGLEDDLVVLVQGNVTVLGNREVEERGSLLLYSGGELHWQAQEANQAKGVFLASEMILSGVALSYCDRAALRFFDGLPRVLRDVCGAFSLQWVDTEHRR